MPWAGLDDGFHEDPRIVDAGLAAAGLYACATTYCARHLTDGVIPLKMLARMLDSGDMAPVDALLSVGLLKRKRGDDEHLEVVDYFPANRPRVEVSRAKAKAKQAASKRWEGHEPKR